MMCRSRVYEDPDAVEGVCDSEIGLSDGHMMVLRVVKQEMLVGLWLRFVSFLSNGLL